MENILILGSSGFIGKHLLNRLMKNPEIKSNKKNICLIKYKKNFTNNLVPKSIDFYDLKLNQTKDILDLISKNKVNTIIHLASGLIPASSRSEFNKEVEELINPSYEIFELALKLGIKTLFISSGGTVYGNNSNPKEGDQLNPVNFYGKSKLLLENYLRSLNPENFNYYILRPSNVYGPFFNVNIKQGLITNVIYSIANNKPIKVWGDGSAVRDYVYIDNLIEVILIFLERCIPTGPYNVGSQIGHSVSEVIEVVENYFDKNATIDFLDNDNEGIKSNVLDVSKLQSVIEYKPYDLQYGIKQTIKSLKT